MRSVEAKPHYIFGLRAGVTNNLCYFDEQTLIYPSGNNCVLYNIGQKCQRFIPGIEKTQGMRACAVSTDRHYLAVSERGEKGTIAVYDLQCEQSWRRMVLSGGNVPVQEFVSLAFSPDSKYLIGQSGAPDWTLYYWMWKKQKVMDTVKTGGIDNPVYQVSFNPQDNAQICVTGNGVFRIFSYVEGALKQSNRRLESQNFLSHAWISKTRVIAGTDTGRLMVFESGIFKWEISMTAGPSVLDTGSCRERDFLSMEKKEKEKDKVAITRPLSVKAIVAYSKGFACSAGQGTMFLFEKTNEKDDYRKTGEIQIPPDQFSDGPGQAGQQEITSLCISPAEETLAISTDHGQLYGITLSSVEINKDGQAQFEFLSHPFHSGIITGLSVCIRKPIIATCSVDRSVRIWNFEKNTMELQREFLREAHSVALHPSGLFILVGFSDSLCLMNLLLDDFQTVKEFDLHGCKECAFSHGGHLFAAVDVDVIQIYSTITFENVLNLKGHIGMIRGVVWSEDDSRLVSCGLDGAVYEWNTLSSERESESVLKSCRYTGVTITPDARTILAVGTDCTLKVIQDCKILREVPSEDVCLTTVAMSHSGRALFAGTSIGTVRVINYPLPRKGEWTEYRAHAGPITKMAITYDEQFLLTASEDRSLLMWKIVYQEFPRLRPVYYTDEILINKSVLEEKNQFTLELKTRLHELKMENEFQSLLSDMDFKNEVKELTGKFTEQITSLKAENEGLKIEKNELEVAHQGAMKELIDRHSSEKQSYESASHRKFILELEQYQELQLKFQGMQADYEQKLHSMEENRSRELAELKRDHESKLQEKVRMLAECQSESQQTIGKLEEQLEELIKQMEKNRDVTANLHIKYENDLKDKEKSNLGLKDEIIYMRKKLVYSGKQGKQRIVEINLKNAERERLINSLKKEIQKIKEEWLEKDNVIKVKAECNSKLEKKILDLETYKRRLQFQLKDLEDVVEPQEKEIEELTEKNNQMDGELQQYCKLNSHLKVNITELKNRLKAANKETHLEMQKVRNMEALVKRFKIDLHNCVGLIQEPKELKDSIRALYGRYVQQLDMVDVIGVDADVQQEFSRQRDHLEKNIASLKKSLATATKVHRKEKMRIFKESSTIINDLNQKLTQVRCNECQGNPNKIHRKQSATGIWVRDSSMDSPVSLEAWRLEIPRRRVEILAHGQTKPSATTTLPPIAPRYLPPDHTT